MGPLEAPRRDAIVELMRFLRFKEFERQNNPKPGLAVMLKDRPDFTDARLVMWYRNSAHVSYKRAGSKQRGDFAHSAVLVPKWEPKEGKWRSWAKKCGCFVSTDDGVKQLHFERRELGKLDGILVSFGVPEGALHTVWEALAATTARANAPA